AFLDPCDGFRGAEILVRLDQCVDLAASIFVFENDFLFQRLVSLRHHFEGNPLAKSLDAVGIELSAFANVLGDPGMAVFVGTDGGKARRWQMIEHESRMLPAVVLKKPAA